MFDAQPCYRMYMRTTLDLDEDVFESAKQLARQQGKTAGQTVSELMREALRPKTARRIRNGVPLFESREGAERADMELVNELRDSE